MIEINSFDDRFFLKDGISHYRKFFSNVRAGNLIRIYNAYNPSDVLVDYINFTQIKLDGVIYPTIAQLQQALLEVIFNGEIGTGTGINQNNIPIAIALNYSGESTEDVLATAVNSLPNFLISERQIAYFLATNPEQPIEMSKKVTFVIKNLGKGAYGQGGTVLTAENILIISVGTPNIYDILPNPRTQIIDLGVINGDVSEAVNALDPPVIVQSQSDGYVVFKATIDVNESNYLFLADGGIYGLGALQTTIDDFLLLQGGSPTITGYEIVANKQDDLTPDPSGNKYTSVTAVINGLNTRADKVHSLTHEMGGSDEIDGENLKIALLPPPSNYAPAIPSLGGHLSAIDARLGQIGNTTAGLTNRVYFTGDNVTVGGTVYFQSSTTGKGTATVGTPAQTVSVNDNQKIYYTKRIASVAQVVATQSPAGNYSGQLSVRIDANNAQQAYGIDIYKMNSSNVLVNSGVTGAPVGSLGVTLVATLYSGVLNLVAGNVSTISVNGNLASTFSLGVGERLIYNVFAEKIGTTAGAINMEVFYGSIYNSYYDIPVVQTTDTVINRSGVTGVTTTDALNTLNSTKVAGSGTVNKIPKFATSSSLTDSIISETSGKIEVATGSGTATFNPVTQPNGSIVLSNSTSGTVPTISGKTTGTSNAIGLLMEAVTVDGSTADMAFNTRTGANSDYTTLTTTAYRWSRFGTILMSLMRNGRLGLGTVNPDTIFHIQDTNGGMFFDGINPTYNRIKSTATASSVGKDFLLSAQTSGVTPDIYIKSNGVVGIGTNAPTGKMEVATGTGTVTTDVLNQALGSIVFSNSGSVSPVPTISGKSNINAGMYLIGSSNDINTNPDFILNARQNTGADFTTLSSTAFRFARFATTLMDIRRDGNVNIGSGVIASDAKLSVQHATNATFTSRLPFPPVEFLRVSNVHNLGGNDQYATLSLHATGNNGSNNAYAGVSVIQPTAGGSNSEISLTVRQGAGAMTEVFRADSLGKSWINSNQAFGISKLNVSGSGGVRLIEINREDASVTAGITGGAGLCLSTVPFANGLNGVFGNNILGYMKSPLESIGIRGGTVPLSDTGTEPIIKLEASGSSASNNFSGITTVSTRPILGIYNFSNQLVVVQPNGNTSFVGNVTIPNGTVSGHAVNKSQLDAVSASIPSVPTLASGVYTPTVTPTANATSITAITGNYTRLGNIVSVNVAFQCTETTALTGSTITVTLPVVRTASTVVVCGSGTKAHPLNNANYSSVIVEVTNTTIATARYVPTATGNQNVSLNFQYSLV